MKNIKLMCFLCLLASCSKRHGGTVAPATDITVITDLTDTLLVYPSAEPILALYDFEDNPNQAVHFRQVLLTDKVLNPAENIDLESGEESDRHNTNDDVTYREQIVYSFQDAVRKAFTDFPKMYPVRPLGHSEAFATIARELNQLAERNASQRILLVFSDLQENEEKFSCYTAKGQRLLHEDPEKVMRILQKRCPLPESLVGVTIFFVFDPPDRDSDVRYRSMAALYKRMLKTRGARVVIQATKKRYEP